MANLQQQENLSITLRRLCVFLESEANHNNITDHGTEQATIVIQFNDANVPGAEQIFEFKGDKTKIGKDRNLDLFSNQAVVNLKVVAEDGDKIERITSTNGHYFGLCYTAYSEGFLPLTESHSKECFFTFDKGGLDFHANNNDKSGKHEYGLEYIPPRINPRPNAAASEATEVHPYR